MKNIKVLSLSVNKIRQLKNFRNCIHLEELYLRDNQIQNLSDIVFLTPMKNLKTLWLVGNPCTKEDCYRLKVIATLPNLSKLDDKLVTSDEVERAQYFKNFVDKRVLDHIDDEEEEQKKEETVQENFLVEKKPKQQMKPKMAQMKPKEKENSNFYSYQQRELEMKKKLEDQKREMERLKKLQYSMDKERELREERVKQEKQKMEMEMEKRYEEWKNEKERQAREEEEKFARERERELRLKQAREEEENQKRKWEQERQKRENFIEQEEEDSLIGVEGLPHPTDLDLPMPGEIEPRGNSNQNDMIDRLNQTVQSLKHKLNQQTEELNYMKKSKHTQKNSRTRRASSTNILAALLSLIKELDYDDLSVLESSVKNQKLTFRK